LCFSIHSACFFAQLLMENGWEQNATEEKEKGKINKLWERGQWKAKWTKTSDGLHTSKFAATGAAGVRALFCSPFLPYLPSVDGVLFIPLLLQLYPPSFSSCLLSPLSLIPLLSPPSLHTLHLINNCIIKPVFMYVCACVCARANTCICFVLKWRWGWILKWMNRDNRVEAGWKGVRLHQISFLILCDDATQTVVSNTVVCAFFNIAFWSPILFVFILVCKIDL